MKRMSSGIAFEPQEILLTSVVFPEQKSKQRPVLVISKFSKQDSRNTFICLPITSSLSDDQFAMGIDAADMQDGRLYKPSQVLCEYYFTQLKTHVIKKIGKVTPQFYQKIKQKIRQDILDI